MAFNSCTTFVSSTWESCKAKVETFKNEKPEEWTRVGGIAFGIIAALVIIGALIIHYRGVSTAYFCVFGVAGIAALALLVTGLVKKAQQPKDGSPTELQDMTPSKKVSSNNPFGDGK